MEEERLFASVNVSFPNDAVAEAIAGADAADAECGLAKRGRSEVDFAGANKFLSKRVRIKES